MYIYRFKTAKVAHHIPRHGRVYEFTSRTDAVAKRREVMADGWLATKIEKVWIDL